MTDDDFVEWVAGQAPSLRRDLTALADHWEGAPPATLVCLEVLIPRFLDAVRSETGDSGRASEMSAMFERMLRHDDFDLPQHAEVTLVPGLADHGADAFDRLLKSLGPLMRSHVSELRNVVVSPGTRSGDEPPH